MCVCVYRGNNHHFSESIFVSAYAYFWNIVRGKAKDDEEKTIQDFEKPIDPGRGANMYSAFVSLQVVGTVQVRILVNATRFSFFSGNWRCIIIGEDGRKPKKIVAVDLSSFAYIPGSVVFIFLFKVKQKYR